MQRFNIMLSPSLIKKQNFQIGSPTLFIGKYFCGLDKDLRFLAPDGFKRYLADEVYITQGFDHNLWVLSNSAFQEIYEKLGRLNVADPLARLLFRLILGAATESGRLPSIRIGHAIALRGPAVECS